MKKIRAKITIARLLQIATYFFAFPFLLYLIDPTFGFGRAQLTVLVIFGVVILTQLIAKLTMKKNRFGRAALVGFIAAILIVGPIITMDFYGKAKYEAIREDAKKEYGRDIGSYEDYLTYPDSRSEKYNNLANKWHDLYNLDGMEGSNIGGANTDRSYDEGTPAGERKPSEVIYDAEDQAYYSMNGMFSDGYIFSLKQVRKILSDYYVLGSKIQKNEVAGLTNTSKKSADTLLAEALGELNSDANSDWNKYKRGESASSISIEGFKYVIARTEYDDAYGVDGSAKKFYLSPERLDALLAALGKHLSGANEELTNLLGNVGGIIGIAGIDLGDFDLSAMLDLVGDILALFDENVTLQVLIDYINTNDLWTDLKGLLGDNILGVDVPDTLNANFVYELLAGLSYYQSPTTYPIMHFIKNPDLKAYAFAKYYGQVHGLTVGSVLIPHLMSPGRVGAITLDSQGSAAPSEAEILSELIDFELYEKYGNIFDPLVKVRNVLFSFGALAFALLMLSYLFTQVIDNNYKKLKPVANR